ncbi:GntR family transcriptional regulator [Mycolicibacterium vaccae]|uniref:GntR family transcriptional regulator n=1 Tax=Mycolicibacterium vaccae TaxID=1810 RepID=UPI003CEC6E17
MAIEGIGPLAVATAPARIADVLRASILDGSIPAGSQLTEGQLAERLNVSRGPVREAIQRLVQEGLLWTKPHHGTFVIELGEDDVADIYLARRAVEGTAAVRMMGRRDMTRNLAELDAAVVDLAAAVSDGGWPGIVEADVRFHERLVEAAGSPRLNRMFRTLTAETRLCLAAFVGAHPDWLRRAVHEHESLVTALRRRDTALTLDLIDRHFQLDESLNLVGDQMAVPRG